MSAPKPPVVSLHASRRCVVRAALVRLPAVLMMVPALLMTFGVVASAEQSQPAGELITIESDQQSADNTTGVVTASGNVRLVHADRGVVATGRQAQYFTKEERIVLSGDVDVVQEDGNALRADRVVYWLGDDRVQATPLAGEQVFSRWLLKSQETPSANP